MAACDATCSFDTRTQQLRDCTVGTHYYFDGLLLQQLLLLITIIQPNTVRECCQSCDW